MFMLYWAINLKRYFWINILILVIGLKHTGNYIAFNHSKELLTNSFKVTSYNVRAFNKYNWIPELEKHKIFDFIEKQNSDILCLQEFYYIENAPKLGYKFKNIGGRKNNKFSNLAIYSKFPQINQSSIKFNDQISSQVCIFSDIIIDNDTVRIYNVHLASNLFKKEDYAFLSYNNVNKGKIKKGILNIANNVIHSSKKRTFQVNKIKNHIKNCPYPIILCGDFNDTPISHAYKNLKGDLIDSFSSSACGIGDSFVKIPYLRIDYILHDQKFDSFQYKKINTVLSDHYPIVCNVKIK